MQKVTVLSLFAVLSLLMVMLLSACDDPDPADTSAPATPTGLTVASGDTKLVLKWKANPEADLANYVFYWGTTSSDLSNKLDIGANIVAFELTGLTNGTPYFIAMTAKDKTGNESPRTSVSEATPLDNAPPTIVSFSPTNGATGVENFSTISISFSEAMDRASVEAAFTITPAVESDGFNWSADGRTLTFVPIIFIYGETYRFGVSAGAKDLAGNALTAGGQSSFTVLRRIEARLYSQPSLDGDVDNTGTVALASTFDFTVAGDLSSNNYNRTFLSFDLSTLPSDLIRIESATLNVRQLNVFGDDIYAAGLGNLNAESVNYGDSLTSSDFDTSILTITRTCEVLSALGCMPGTYPLRSTFSPATRALEYKRASVEDAVQLDWQNRAERGNRSQFRLKFERDVTTDSANDYVALYSATAAMDNRPYLDIVYLIP